MKRARTFFMLILGFLLISATVEERKCRGEKVPKKTSVPKSQKKSATKIQPLFEILFRV